MTLTVGVKFSTTTYKRDWNSSRILYYKPPPHTNLNHTQPTHNPSLNMTSHTTHTSFSNFHNASSPILPYPSFIIPEVCRSLRACCRNLPSHISQDQATLYTAKGHLEPRMDNVPRRRRASV